MVKTLLKLIFYLSVFLFVISFFEKDRLPKNVTSSDFIQEPRQTKVNLPSFEVKKNDITYIIKPLYEYELYGMIVSEHASSDLFDYYHDKWNDFINLKDICVAWGDNVKTGSYNYFDFESGSWTCYARSKPGIEPEKWTQFKFNQFSNNHLLSDNPDINKNILAAEKGDKIHFKGYLVEYSIKGGTFKRGTSTTRNDDGNGACETVFLTNFEIIEKANPLWREIFSLSAYLAALNFIIFAIIYLKEP